MVTRREFLGTISAGAAGAAFASSARSYGQILGANDRVGFAVIGLNGRASAHLDALIVNKAAARVAHVCDVDSVILKRFADRAEQRLGYPVATHKDFRELLAMKDVDAVTIATPDHWHTPMAIAAMQAGKHVYVEKPCSHNPAEGMMLVEAQKKTGKLAQMGNQRRSAPHIIEIVDKIHNGLIGRAYYSKGWYSNVRKSIGFGKEAPVPDHLDWDLWQGPAPRTAFHDNYQPYNWHWFRRWGTGETLNNGTHEIDVARWALGVDLPNRVSSSGGRYHFKDDWQFYDTLVTSFEYGDALIAWEGKCCEGMKDHGRDRGTTVIGTTGSVFVDGSGYEIYDLNGKMLSQVTAGKPASSADLTGNDGMTELHFANFIAAVQKGEKLNAPVAEGNVAVTMLQLSNVAYFTQRALTLNPKDGRIQNDAEAMKMWGRQYESGWAPKV